MNTDFEKGEKSSGWFCMKLVTFIYQYNANYSDEFEKAKQGNCRFKLECPVYKRTISKQKIMQQKLFEIETILTMPTQLKHTCKDCAHRQRWQCNSKVFHYCAVRKSKRTDNGLLKVKCKDKACQLFRRLLDKRT